MKFNKKYLFGYGSGFNGINAARFKSQLFNIVNIKGTRINGAYGAISKTYFLHRRLKPENVINNGRFNVQLKEIFFFF